MYSKDTDLNSTYYKCELSQVMWLISVGGSYTHGGTWNGYTLSQGCLDFPLLSPIHSVIWFCCCHRAREWSSSRKLTQDQTVPGDSNVQAISNVQRIQRLWLIILFPLPSPADFVQVFYGYLEDLENRQREDFANFFCLGLRIPYTDGGQPQLRATPDYTAFNLRKEKWRETLPSPTTLSIIRLWLANWDSKALLGVKYKKE